MRGGLPWGRGELAFGRKTSFFLPPIFIVDHRLLCSPLPLDLVPKSWVSGKEKLVCHVVIEAQGTYVMTRVRCHHSPKRHTGANNHAPTGACTLVSHQGYPFLKRIFSSKTRWLLVIWAMHHTGHCWVHRAGGGWGLHPGGILALS